MAKLLGYCLNRDHARGKHKAEVFAAVLGLTREHAMELQVALLRAARDEDAEPGELDAYGQRFVVDFDVEGPLGRATVRSAWIIRSDEDFPRLTSCWVK